MITLCNLFQEKRDVFSISNNSTTRLISLSLEVTSSCSSVHCWHSVLVVLQLTTSKQSVQSWYLPPNTTLNQLKHHLSCPVTAEAVRCPHPSAPAHLCSKGHGTDPDCCWSHSLAISQGQQCLQQHSSHISASSKSPWNWNLIYLFFIPSETRL